MVVVSWDERFRIDPLDVYVSELDRVRHFRHEHIQLLARKVSVSLLRTTTLTTVLAGN